MTNARHSKATPRWGTPTDWVAMSRTALGGRIELDPMSEPIFNATVGAERIYTEQDDGLVQDWTCETMLLNPAGGLVVPAWQKLTTGWRTGAIARCVWIGFSVEQLALLADHDPHPMDFCLLICRNRMDFLTVHPRRLVVSVSGSDVTLECGHVARLQARKEAAPKSYRCSSCVGTPEPNGSPSHANYVVGLGVTPAAFTSAFAGRGRFSFGCHALVESRKIHHAIADTDAVA